MILYFTVPVKVLRIQAKPVSGPKQELDTCVKPHTPREDKTNPEKLSRVEIKGVLRGSWDLVIA